MRSAPCGKRDTPPFRCWYVNLQDPLRRTTLCFDTMDDMLDIVISPDLSAWHWKDEDDLDEAVKIGLYSPEQEIEMRAEGESVIQTLHEKSSIFNQGWEKWSPPTDCQTPVFPSNWDYIEKSMESLTDVNFYLGSRPV
jgi:hypothetical protein